MRRFFIIVLCTIGTALIALAAGAAVYLIRTAPHPDRPITWGVTFSEKFAREMGLDARNTYRAILDDLGARYLRVVAYWDLIEPAPGARSFDDLDWVLREADARGAQVILAIGMRVPRWPECHVPAWAEALNVSDRHTALLEYLRDIIARERSHSSLHAWQVENEPFFATFGNCEPLDESFLRREIALVHELDPGHPVITTQSGELGSWRAPVRLGDEFGTTMYRRVHNKMFGFIQYPLPPWFFRLKTALTRALANDWKKLYHVMELGAEPWLPKQLYETTPEEQLKVFDLPFFKDTIRYAKEAGFDDYYLWGAEWWYWIADRGHPEFWDYAKTLFRETNR